MRFDGSLIFTNAGHFENEVIGYENNINLLNQLTLDPNNILNFIPERSKDAFRLYQKHFL